MMNRRASIQVLEPIAAMRNAGSVEYHKQHWQHRLWTVGAQQAAAGWADLHAGTAVLHVKYTDYVTAGKVRRVSWGSLSKLHWQLMLLLLLCCASGCGTASRLLDCAGGIAVVVRMWWL